MSRQKESSATMRAKGSRKDHVAKRAEEERQAGIAAVVTPLRPHHIEVPAEVIDPDAVAVFEHVSKHFKLDVPGRVMLTQACLALQRANQLRAAIDAVGVVEGRAMLANERDARLTYQKLTEKLGL